MSFSFTPSLPTKLDRIRVLVGDVTATGHLVEDEEIAYYQTYSTSDLWCAALALDVMGARYAGVPDVQVGQKKIAGSQLAVQFHAQAERYRTLDLDGPSPGSGMPYLAGIDVWEPINDRANLSIPLLPFGEVGAEPMRWYPNSWWPW